MFRWSRAAGAAKVCFLVGVSAAVLGGACKTEKQETNQLRAGSGGGNDVAVQATKDGVVIASKDGKQTLRLDTSSGKVPEDWPKEVPMYPGSTINLSMRLGEGYTLSQEMPEAPAKVAEFYKAQLSGMQLRSTVDLGKGQTLQWIDESKPLQVTLTLSPTEGGKTRATLILTRDRPRGGAAGAPGH